jgi:hypothetical protein
MSFDDKDIEAKEADRLARSLLRIESRSSLYPSGNPPSKSPRSQTSSVSVSPPTPHQTAVGGAGPSEDPLKKREALLREAEQRRLEEIQKQEEERRRAEEKLLEEARRPAIPASAATVPVERLAQQVFPPLLCVLQLVTNPCFRISLICL